MLPPEGMMAQQRYHTAAGVGRAGNASETGGEGANNVITALESAAQLTEYVTKYGKVAQHRMKRFTPYVANSLKQRPMMTLAAGAAVGFVLGALWRK